jgi:SUMO ligase MMS21 Smc5/6 complex component
VASVGGADLAARVKCQITRKRMTDPVRNGLCSHVYDRAGIMLLNRPGRPWLCPIAGALRAR